MEALTPDGYIHDMTVILEHHADPVVAKSAERYLKNLFTLYGIKAPLRRELFKTYYKTAGIPSINDMPRFITLCWSHPQREIHYFGMETLMKYANKLPLQSIEWMEHMVTRNAWWDTVDMIAIRLMGPYFIQYPRQRDPITSRWMASDHMWLQRCALLFQLKYKENTDEQLLYQYIEQLITHRDFFIRKAIGWVLREYSKTNPQSVQRFVDSHSLSALSRREAIKYL